MMRTKLILHLYSVCIQLKETAKHARWRYNHCVKTSVESYKDTGAALSRSVDLFVRRRCVCHKAVVRLPHTILESIAAILSFLTSRSARYTYVILTPALQITRSYCYIRHKRKSRTIKGSVRPVLTEAYCIVTWPGTNQNIQQKKSRQCIRNAHMVLVAIWTWLTSQLPLSACSHWILSIKPDVGQIVSEWNKT